MKKQSIIIIIAIILVMILGFFILKDKPEDMNKFDTPTNTPTPKKDIKVPDPVACYNEDGVLTECKG